VKVGFVGLGNVGGRLAASALRNGFELTVHDLDHAAAGPLLAAGAAWANRPSDVAGASDVVVTCLPGPAAINDVMEAADGILAGLRPGTVWIEMSTTDVAQVHRLAERVAGLRGFAADCPVSGGCHRAATGNIAILAGCERPVFDRILPLLTAMGRDILHTGPVGSASVLKVVTNYLATAHLVALGEAMTTAGLAGMDLATTYEAIRISSGNSFVHETEGQVILNGSRDINFTMDLLHKDVTLFNALADRCRVALDLAPVLLDVVTDALDRYGPREWSPNIVRRLEELTGLALRAPGFPGEIVDHGPPEPGCEVIVARARPST
jgi:3-hydroxyisobutyrate dehydrogenase